MNLPRRRLLLLHRGRGGGLEIHHRCHRRRHLMKMKKKKKKRNGKGKRKALLRRYGRVDDSEMFQRDIIRMVIFCGVVILRHRRERLEEEVSDRLYW